MEELKVLKPGCQSDLTACSLKDAISQMWNANRTDKTLTEVKFILACPAGSYTDIYDEIIKDREEYQIDTLLGKMNIDIIPLPSNQFGMDGWLLYSPDLNISFYNEGA